MFLGLGKMPRVQKDTVNSFAEVHANILGVEGKELFHSVHMLLEATEESCHNTLEGGLQQYS